MIYAVIRKAVLPEDEGREEYIKPFDTREQAEAWIKDQDGEYFSSSDYYIQERANI